MWKAPFFRILIFGGRCILGYSFPRVLIAFGVPLDDLIAHLPSWFTYEIVFWLFMVIIGGLIFSLTYLLPYPVQRKKRSQADGNSLRDNQSSSVLRDIGRSKSDPEAVLFAFGEYDYSAVPLNEKWADWISYDKGRKGLVATVNRPDLDYYNFGNEFYFYELISGKSVSIPTSNLAKQLNVSGSFQKGMVLHLRPKNS